MSAKVVVAAGLFDPLDSSHIRYLQKSKDLGHSLIVIIHNDRQAVLQKGRAFMPARERVRLVRSLGCVDMAIESTDDDTSVCKSLSMIHPDIFCINGGLSTTEFPEAAVCSKLGIRVIDVLGEKVQLSDRVIKQSLSFGGQGGNTGITVEAIGALHGVAAEASKALSQVAAMAA
eukprot:TRINITY_DN1876_c0_g2_i2.p1 TRINITY_DN1876_c0_g2~~TRINITY_DN1876_c0_g2_i2.p1  ORF type:complete len:174 (+),score=29.92 TRINITY_DN1876_c0_g2_i2:102-623(+)